MIGFKKFERKKRSVSGEKPKEEAAAAGKTKKVAEDGNGKNSEGKADSDLGVAEQSSEDTQS